MALESRSLFISGQKHNFKRKLTKGQRLISKLLIASLLLAAVSISSKHKQRVRKQTIRKSRKENPQKLTQLSSRSHPRHLVGKRTAQKVTIIDITSDSQVNSNFPYRWSPASLTFNNYFYLFLYLYKT